jgi:hypothetical protein
MSPGRSLLDSQHMHSRMKKVARKPAKKFRSPELPPLDFYQKVLIIAKGTGSFLGVNGRRVAQAANVA